MLIAIAPAACHWTDSEFERRQRISGGSAPAATIFNLIESFAARAKSARQLNLHALLRKYGPGVIVVLFVAGGLWWRFFR